MEVIRDEVLTKANEKEVKRLIGDFDLHLENFNELRRKFNATVDTQHKLQDNTKDISITLESKINKVETNIQTNQVDVLGRLSQLRSQINDQVVQLELKIQDAQQKINTKLTADDLTDIKMHINTLANQHQLDSLRKEVLPEVVKMRERISDFTDQNYQMKEMIRRFDEIVSDKASKSMLT